MKSYLPLLKVLIVCCLGVFLLSTISTGAEREDWKILQEDSYHNTFSYDTGSVERSAGNTITVSASSNGAKYLYEIDCRNKKARIIEKPGAAGPDWFAISSGSGELLLYNTLCP
ncbi:MAG TPA: hypothetical protein VN328_13665 [Thermodesulfovibrionales bacterium]|nr:hypothetical protein [Thermodesulfovibrionales bacterium]